MLVRDEDTLCNFQINPGGWRPSWFQMMLNLNSTTFIVAVLRESTNIPAWTFHKVNTRATAIVGCEWYWNLNFSIQMQSRQKVWRKICSQWKCSKFTFLQKSLLVNADNECHVLLVIVSRKWHGFGIKRLAGSEVDERIIRASREDDTCEKLLLWCI